MNLKNILLREKSQIQKPHGIWVHVYEMSKYIDKKETSKQNVKNLSF